MTPPRSYSDAGQAFPIYIIVVAGLLFLAFAYFAVGQAAVNRNGAQTAADAAALAAAQETRDQLAGLWVDDVLDPTKWDDIFHGVGAVYDGCDRAGLLAAQNDAKLGPCDPGVLSYTVGVTTNKPVGDSVVPGTEGIHSEASATAVIERLCSFELPGEDGVLPQLTCKDGKTWDLNPDDLTDLPEPQDLFDVHLAE
ncbi:pilus assembly protein TadG-related protein [Streptomyces sp. NPDC057257]|uniref:pilus assembly protein TadG-related protein n=1 Tax=Streptomyces sp. NPDC057257 TaxID=3346071 RepID=UPI00363D5B6B